MWHCPPVEPIPKEGFHRQIVCYDLMMMRKKQRLVHTLPNHETVRITFINEYVGNISQAGNISQSRLEIIQTWVHRNQKSDAISNFPSLSAANSADANIAQTQTHWSIKSSGQLLNSQNVIFSDYCWKYVSGPWTNIAKREPSMETSWNWRKAVGNNLPASGAFLLRKITKFQTRGTFRLLIQQICRHILCHCICKRILERRRIKCFWFRLLVDLRDVCLSQTRPVPASQISSPLPLIGSTRVLHHVHSSQLTRRLTYIWDGKHDISLLKSIYSWVLVWYLWIVVQ